MDTCRSLLDKKVGKRFNKILIIMYIKNNIWVNLQLFALIIFLVTECIDSICCPFHFFLHTSVWHLFLNSPKFSWSLEDIIQICDISLLPTPKHHRPAHNLSYVHMHNFELVSKARKESTWEKKSGLPRNLHKPVHWSKLTYTQV